jgi:pimeloyl-ACP methyl ester carboxylesterase
VPLEIVADHDIRYYLLAFDKQGRERPEEGSHYSRTVVNAAEATSPTDVFVFSHGWNGDMPAARRQYEKWLAAMANCVEDRKTARQFPGGFRPLLVGLHWPSKAWGEEEIRPASFAIEADVSDDDARDDIDDLVDRYSDLLVDSPRVRESLRTIFKSAMIDAAPITLPSQVRHAYEVIDAESGLGHAGVGSAPGDDRELFDAEATYQACQLEEVASYGDWSLGGVLAPLRVLTFWQMKRRARDFGESGARRLLAALQQVAPDARVHLMGHSFGCIVASAAVAGPTNEGSPARPVDTLVLVQGAMSLWSFCDSIPARPEERGYFNRIVTDHLVKGPILATTSVHDRAVGTFYPMGASARGQIEYNPLDLPAYGAVGTFGIQGSGLEIINADLATAQGAYDFRGGAMYNLDSDDVISDGSGLMGAHSDICHTEVAHAVWRATFVGRHLMG